MRRIISFVIVSFIVTLLCVRETIGQDGDYSAAEQPAVATEDEGAAEEEVEPPPVPPRPANVLTGMLLSPGVSDRLGLDDRQRTDISRILRQQVEEISRFSAAGATEEQFWGIYQRTEDRLRDILTATQRAMLERGLDDQTIRMVFVHQPWRDVLQFIANQTGMQLVLDAPPPAGTFNYSSRETYTITQALDLINDILIPRGYNFTRSGNQRMLHLINLNSPGPNWSLPTERPDNLGARASSEFVSVAHNFSRRTPETVAAAVRGQLGAPFSRYWLAGQNIIVFDRVEVQRRLPNVITNSQRDPDAPPAPRPPQVQRQPAPPVWRTYTLENERIDPEFVIRTFREWAGGIRVIHQPGAQTIHIYARTGDHNTLEGLLRRLETDAAALSADPDAATPVPQQGNRTIRLHPVTPRAEP